jgi:hypothetical protein
MNFETHLELTQTQWHDAQLCRLSDFPGGDAAEAVLELQLYHAGQSTDFQTAPDGQGISPGREKLDEHRRLEAAFVARPSRAL